MKKYISSVIAVLGFIVFTANLSADEQSADTPIGILLAAGDISHCGDKTYANKTAKIIRRVIRDARSAQPAIPVKVLALGDLAYFTGKEKELNCFARNWSGFDDILLPVPGNHEYFSTDAKPYFEHFKDNDFVQQQKIKRRGYFVVNFPRKDGPWRLIGLNSEIKKKGGEKDNFKEVHQQLKWLKQQLDNDTIPCVLAFWHKPTFTSGHHGHVGKALNAPLKRDDLPMQAAMSLLYKYGASLVLAGHEHNYEQFKRHNAEGQVAKDDGIRSFVVGTGGTKLREDRYTQTWKNISEGLYGKTKLKDGKQGVLKITLFERRYEWKFLSIDKSFSLPPMTKKDDCIKRKKP